MLDSKMSSTSGSANVCPLCGAPVGSGDELQLHYLTSCSGYDKAVSNEQPRSKLAEGATGGSSPVPPTGAPAKSTVQFMWQPLTEISYPKITFLASFEPGNVELSLEDEGSYYASDHVTIPKGTYEGQLVIGESFIHPVKEFTIEKDPETVILQFEVTPEVV